MSADKNERRPTFGRVSSTNLDAIRARFENKLGKKYELSPVKENKSCTEQDLEKMYDLIDIDHNGKVTMIEVCTYLFFTCRSSKFNHC